MYTNKLNESSDGQLTKIFLVKLNQILNKFLVKFLVAN